MCLHFLTNVIEIFFFTNIKRNLFILFITVCNYQQRNFAITVNFRPWRVEWVIVLGYSLILSNVSVSVSFIRWFTRTPLWHVPLS